MSVTRQAKLLTSLAFASLLAGCVASEPIINGLPPVQVTASGETEPVGTSRADAADEDDNDGNRDSDGNCNRSGITIWLKLVAQLSKSQVG